MKKVTRRELLKIAALAGGGILLPIGLQYRGYAQRTDERVEPFRLAFRKPPVLNPVRSDSSTDYYEIAMQIALLEILPGRRTQIWGYNGIFPGPTIKQRKNRQSVVRFINNLSINTSVHLHGMPSQPQYDGYAEDLISPGFYKDYVYHIQTALPLLCGTTTMHLERLLSMRTWVWRGCILFRMMRN
ncbi:hypothetical protein CAL7716_004540 [Calothrix sp. PCC 7716]|nr:hypothetical protein CAL7716_004540 [Calothrix sp. PCC 7716]